MKGTGGQLKRYITLFLLLIIITAGCATAQVERKPASATQITLYSAVNDEYVQKLAGEFEKEKELNRGKLRKNSSTGH